MYIGAIPTPAATESRQEFTATANQTVFNTTGGTVGYCDCFLNGVKMANSDFSFDGADVTLTTGAAAGDVLAVVMRQADNALVALPIKDSAGNNVLSETNNVASISSGVRFPAGMIVNVVTQSPTITAAQYPNTNAGLVCTGSEYLYTPASNASKVWYEYHVHIAHVDFDMVVGFTVELEDSNGSNTFTYASGRNHGIYNPFNNQNAQIGMYTIAHVFDAWSGARKIRTRAAGLFNGGTIYETKLHETDYNIGAASANPGTTFGVAYVSQF